MKRIKLVALGIACALSAGAMAQTIGKTEYKDGKSRIVAEYMAARTNCTALSGNANDICVANAKGQEKVAKAELEASYKPSDKHHFDVRTAKADAEYGVAKQKCDNLSGNVKDVCVKQAKAARTDAKADAKTQLTSARANALAAETAAEARSEASVTSGEARQDANAEKVEAKFTVDKEKCNAFSGAAKDNCLDKAMLSAGK